MAQTIYKRLIVEEIKKYLHTNDIIVLHGARQVGKTSILNYLKNLLDEQNETTHYIDLEDSRYVRILDTGVDEFIKYLKEESFVLDENSLKDKKVYIFIDEIQYLANPSSFLKLIADHHQQIKLIVSGSSSFDIKSKFKDSLVGRTVDFNIFNLSFEEFLLFKNYRFQKENIYTEKKTKELISLFEEYILFGGYPKIVLTDDVEKKGKYIQQIIDTYIKKDIRDLAKVENVGKFNHLLEILASQSGQLLNVVEVANTIKLSKLTVERYLFLLEQTYIVRLVRPYKGNIRSELSKTPKVFFYDTGLMQMLWLKELPKQILGQVFETGIFAELIKKYGIEKIFYWRTTDKKEIDFIVKKAMAVTAIEAKLNFARFQSSAMNFFLEKYMSKDGKVVGLRGEKGNKNNIYPWEM